METPTASFITMIMDRLHGLEANNDRRDVETDMLRHEVDEMRKALDTRAPAITLLAHSGYTHFSDGFSLFWNILEEPLMLSVHSQWPPRDEIDEDDFVPLDDKHWNAVAFPCPTIVMVESLDDAIPIPRFVIGKRGCPVTVGRLVTELHEQLRRPLPDHPDRTAADLLEGGGSYSSHGHFSGFAPLHDALAHEGELLLRLTE